MEFMAIIIMVVLIALCFILGNSDETKGRKLKLIEAALLKENKIGALRGITGKKKLDRHFIVNHQGKLVFWYNDEDNSTTGIVEGENKWQSNL